MGVAEGEVLGVERFVSPCGTAETLKAIEGFDFKEGAVAMHTKWLGYNRKSSITITACESDGGTLDDRLFYAGVPRFKLLSTAGREKVARRWGKLAQLKLWQSEQSAAE